MKNKKRSWFSDGPPLLLLLLFALSDVANGQSSYVYQALPTQQLVQPLQFDMGNTKKAQLGGYTLNGYELNFWALPFFTAGVTTNQTIVNINNYLKITFFSEQASQAIGFGMYINATDQGSGYLPSTNNASWVNVNLRVWYGQYIVLNAWQGPNWYELNPSIAVVNLMNNTAPLESETQMWIMATDAKTGCYVSDFRVQKINANGSFSQYIRHYEVPWNNLWTNTLSYIFIRDGLFNLQPQNQPSYNVSLYKLQNMTVLRCNQTYAMQADGSCSMNCLTSKCLFCQTTNSDYFNICRFCNGVSSSCTAISRCPNGYYLSYGICYACPIGCTTCTSAAVCTSCQSGLVLSQVIQTVSSTDLAGVVTFSQVVTSGTCNCPIGQFGTFDYTSNYVACDKCDPTCYTCAQTNIQCTSCKAPLFLITVQGQTICTPSCSTMISNYYGETTNQTCMPCESNCLACTSAKGCTNCANFNATIFYQVTQNDTDGVPMLDGNGNNIMVTKNYTKEKQLINAQGVCVEQCPSNSIDNSTFGTCSMCPNECTTCSVRSSNCTSCNVDIASLFLTYNTSVTPAIQSGSCPANCPKGYFPLPVTTGQVVTQKVCKPCDPSCTECSQINYCTKCTMDVANGLFFNFINFQCKPSCGDMYYPDHTDPTYYFCRSCPSNCQTCVSASTCTSCTTNYYLTTTGEYTLCVLAQDCVAGSYPDQDSGECLSCISNCAVCSGSTGCTTCFDGYFLHANTCVPNCPVSTYPMANGTCAPCITNCTACRDSLTCSQCAGGSSAGKIWLLEDAAACTFANSCPDGYFNSQQNNCSTCPPQCEKCNSRTVCTTCILNNYLNGMMCVSKCGNGLREDTEYCDDGNNYAGDGCAPDCTVEDGFICDQGVLVPPATSAPDTCRCDPSLVIAQYKDYWGTISITFNSVVYFNSSNALQSPIPSTFCQQILQPATIALLGTMAFANSAYGCYLNSLSSSSSELLIMLPPDAIIGDQGMNYITKIRLIEGALLVQGCIMTGIPIKYNILNLPLDTPQVLVSATQGVIQPKTAQLPVQTLSVAVCAADFSLNLVMSKGLTKRAPSVAWVPRISPQSDQLTSILTSLPSTNSFFRFDESLIEQLQGFNVTLETGVSNFLAISNMNNTNLVFSTRQRQLSMLDLPDSVTFQPGIANQLYPRIRVPVCTNDAQQNLVQIYQGITVSCSMYDTAMTTKVWPLVNCTIPPNNMSLSSSYIVQVQASYSQNQSWSTQKKVWVQPSAPPVQIALIQGCNRVFSPNNSFTLTAIYNTNPATTTFVWYCIDKATGSVCFSTNYQYITLGNQASVTAPMNIFFYGMQYDITVTAFDSLSNTNSSITCSMYSSGAKEFILDVQIVGEATQTGFIDFSRSQIAFKSVITNLGAANLGSLQYKWWVTDSSGNSIPANQISIYQNSMGVLTKQMSRNSLYTVYLNVTDGKSWGNSTQTLRTQPNIEIEFYLEASDSNPVPLTTVFSLSVFSQETFESLNQYVFGYINPDDGVTKIPMTKKSYMKFVQFILPQPTQGSSITCYVDVVMTNGVTMTYSQTTQLGLSGLLVVDFMQQVQSTVMDDILESMQMKHKLVSLSGKMTVTQRSQAILQILAGLQSMPTLLSDFYIQSSVGSLLQYISQQTDCMTQTPQIVNISASLFQKMTIGENGNLEAGKAIQYGSTVTANLFNFANNLLMMDLSSIVGGTSQLQIKSMLTTGLQNVLLGSLSNMILGDAGGFSYQGKNLYAKAVKFDSLEQSFFINASLPAAIQGKLVQNFVNMSLPSPASGSNPCIGLDACQITIIIQTNWSSTWMSNGKNGVLKSFVVGLTIQKTELTSPNSFIIIESLKVANLTSPILMTMPTYTPLDTSNPNNTLACGYFDPLSTIFAQTGFSTTVITNSLVTCRMNHLSQIAVEQYEQSISTSSQTSVSSFNASAQDQQHLNVAVTIDMWSSWAIYADFGLAGILVLGYLYMRRLDTRDEQYLDIIRRNKKRIYVNLFLEPIEDIKKSLPMIEEIPKKEEAIKKEEPEKKEDQVKKEEPQKKEEPVKKEESNKKEKSEPQKKEDQAPNVLWADDFGGSQSASTAKKKKKKKKKAGVDPLEKDLFFEGGDDDDFFAIAEAEEMARSQQSKKSKKKKKKTVQKDEEALPAIPTRGRTLMIQDLDINEIEDVKSKKSKKSSRSKSKKKKKPSDTQSGFDFEVDGKSQKSSKSKKSLGKKKKKKRSVLKGDFADEEAVELNPKRKEDEAAILLEAPMAEEKLDTQSKGFETLMNEEIQKAKNEMKDVKKRVAENKKKKEEKKRRGYFEKEAASCVQFCIWNCTQNNRCKQQFRFYNQYLPRSTRWLLFVMSWFMFLDLTGYLLTGGTIFAARSSKMEQFIEGTVAAFVARLWVVSVTAFLMRAKAEKIYDTVVDPREAKFKICVDSLRYFLGATLALGTMVYCSFGVFEYSKVFEQEKVGQWMWCFIFALIGDLVAVDGAFIALTTFLTMTVGSAPDACGRCRNMWLNTVPEAVREASE